MKRILIGLVFLCAACAHNPRISNESRRIVFFGDSITELGVRPGGYITRMRLALDARSLQYDLIGAGVSGDKIYDLYLRMEEDVLSHRPDTVVIWVGVNDVWHKQIHNTGTDAPKFERFYAALIRKFQAEGIRVVLVTPMGVGEKRPGENPLDAELDKYSEIIRSLAAKYHCPLIDVRKAFQAYIAANNPADQDSGILTYDRVHPNDSGNRWLAEKMLQALVPSP